jgi:L-lactate dehydrogenase complex protein LldG
MSGAREQILARLRQTLDRGQPRSVAVEQRLRERRCGPQPAWTEDLSERFCAKLQAAAGSVARVADGPQLVAAVTDYLQAQGLPPELLLAPDPRLDALSWPSDLTVRRGPAEGERVGLSWALAGIAETGSLLLASGPHTPTALNFLVDDFLCILPTDRLVPYLEDAWQLVRAELGVFPRALNLITGPSRTADVEQTIQLGAHGPRRLHLLLLEAGG